VRVPLLVFGGLPGRPSEALTGAEWGRPFARSQGPPHSGRPQGVTWRETPSERRGAVAVSRRPSNRSGVTSARIAPGATAAVMSRPIVSIMEARARANTGDPRSLPAFRATAVLRLAAECTTSCWRNARSACSGGRVSRRCGVASHRSQAVRAALGAPHETAGAAALGGDAARVRRQPGPVS
jgi:hypothetical protein